MSNPSPTSFAYTSLAVIALLLFSVLRPESTPTASEPFDGVEMAQAIGLDLTLEHQRANALVQTLPLTEVLGSLAPIALSPFFALTCLSGASMLADAGILPSYITNNFIMGANSPLNNTMVFVGLLGLTVLTAAPKLTKVSKPLAQAVDQLEAYSGIVAAIAVQFLYQLGSDSGATAEVVVSYHAGFIETTYATVASLVIMAFTAINIFVINSVKFFFEVMILISPIPAVDAIFEAANKAFTGFLLLVYLINPWLAAAINLILFAICLAIFAWTYRRVVFMRCVLIDPLLGWLAEAILRFRPVTLNSTRTPRSVRQVVGSPEVILKAFAGKKMKGIPKKTLGYFLHAKGRSYFVRTFLLRAPRVVELGAGIKPAPGIRQGLFAHSIVFTNNQGETTQKILFTKRYNQQIANLQRALHAIGKAQTNPDTTSFDDLGAGFAKGLKNADQGDLRSELA